MTAGNLKPHGLKVALICPQIAPNTGNIARLCVASGAELHLVRPLGFVLSDRQLKRSAMDYWDRLKLTIHDDVNAFLAASTVGQRWCFSTKGERSIWDTPFEESDWLIFGNESHGLPDAMMTQFAASLIRIPQQPGERCLNLSTSVGIGVYEAIRQCSTRSNR